MEHREQSEDEREMLSRIATESPNAARWGGRVRVERGDLEQIREGQHGRADIAGGYGRTDREARATTPYVPATTTSHRWWCIDADMLIRAVRPKEHKLELERRSDG